MPTPGANIKYDNSSFLWECFLRKFGFKPKKLNVMQPTGLSSMTVDPGTTFPRNTAICSKYSTTTAPTSNTAADAPTGVGDICVYFAANNVGLAHIAVANIHIYRCSAYTNSTTFTWTLMLS